MSTELAGALYVPVVPVPGRWTFWADMAVAPHTALGPVQLSAFRATSKLSGFGSGTATVVLSGTSLPQDRVTRLWSWRLWAFYAGAPVWCGVPTGLADTGAATVDLTLTELPGYLGKRQFDVSPSKVYTQVEQTTIAGELAAPLADVGVPVVLQAGAGFKRDRTYEYLENDRGELLAALAGVLQGPEFRAEYGTDAGGLPTCTLRIAYPRVGSGAAQLGLSVPGAALGYSATWDTDQLRTRTYAVGDLPDNAAQGAPKPVKVLDAPQSDLPRLDEVDDWPGVVLTSTLNEKASTASTQQAAPALALTATPSEAYPPVTTYAVGDDVTVRAVTPLMPGGLTSTGRLTQIDIDAAAGTAAWTIAVPMPPPKSRETLNRRLARIDTTLAGVFHSGPLANV